MKAAPPLAKSFAMESDCRTNTEHYWCHGANPFCWQAADHPDKTGRRANQGHTDGLVTPLSLQSAIQQWRHRMPWRHAMAIVGRSCGVLLPPLQVAEPWAAHSGLGINTGITPTTKNQFASRDVYFHSLFLLVSTIVYHDSGGCLSSLKTHIDTLRPRQNCRQFAEFRFRWNLFFWAQLPKLIKIVVWRGTGDKQLSEPIVIKFTDAKVSHSASMD